MTTPIHVLCSNIMEIVRRSQKLRKMWGFGAIVRQKFAEEPAT